MKFALVKGVKSEAQKGLQGVCQSCGAELVAKCGKIKVNHWAHKKLKECDNWWENETEWHRNWKNQFPLEWQEIIAYDDKTNEKHIADVKTKHGLVLEFQHSNIEESELKSREQFYKNMIWIVDGVRLKRAYPKFLKCYKNEYENLTFSKTEKENVYEVDLAEWCFPEKWINSTVPVIFDYYGDGTLENNDGLRTNLYCLFPKVGRYHYVAQFTIEAFIKSVFTGEWESRVKQYIDQLNYSHQEKQKEEKIQAEKRYSKNRINFNQKHIFKRKRIK